MHLLQKTSAFLLCPIIAISNKIREPIEHVLTFLIFAVVLTSQFFWSNPIRGAKSHRIDSYVTKFAIMVFIFYTFSRGFSNIWWKISYMTVIVMMAAAFWLSNRESLRNCHIVGVVGSLYALF
jgi:hypothetical protein